jgi:O-antigen ligase
MRYEFTAAHVELIDVLHDSGLPGVLVYLLFVCSVLKLLWLQMKQPRDEWQPLYYCYFFGVLALLMNSFASAFINVSHVFGNFLAFFLSTLAVIVASAQGYRQAENSPRRQFQPSSPGWVRVIDGPGRKPEHPQVGNLETCQKKANASGFSPPL